MDFASYLVIMQLLVAAQSWRAASLGPILLSFDAPSPAHRGVNALERHARTGHDALADAFQMLFLAAAGPIADFSNTAAAVRCQLLAELETKYERILTFWVQGSSRYQEGDEDIPVTSAAVLGSLARAIVMVRLVPLYAAADKLDQAEAQIETRARKVAEMIPVCGQNHVTWASYAEFKAWVLGQRP